MALPAALLIGANALGVAGLGFEGLSTYDRFVTRPRTRRKMQAARLEFALDDTFAMESAYRTLQAENAGLGAQLGFLRGTQVGTSAVDNLMAAQTRDSILAAEGASLARISAVSQPSMIDLAAALGVR